MNVKSIRKDLFDCLNKHGEQTMDDLVTRLGSWTRGQQIDQLTKQRDDLLDAFEKFMDSHEECIDFDGFTAQIVSMDDYHEAQEAIAAVKDK